YRRRGPLRRPSLSVTTASSEVPIDLYAGAYYALIYSEARIIYVYLYPRNAAPTGCLLPTGIGVRYTNSNNTKPLAFPGTLVVEDCIGMRTRSHEGGPR
ncbi:MAG TPA: hypothetical protein VGE93_20895, partial [Bryobacteraceae bacterium]